MSEPKTELVSGKPIPDDYSHTSLKSNGQQQDYIVLTEAERAKGFIRPVRDSYIHAGDPLRGQLERLEKPYLSNNGKTYIAVDRFEVSPGTKAGKFLTEQEVKQIEKTGRYGGCGGLTKMARSIAETYARDPKFYSGTFCVHCGTHFMLSQFVWDGTNENVGS